MPCTGTPSAFAQCTHTCWLLAVSVRFHVAEITGLMPGSVQIPWTGLPGPADAMLVCPAAFGCITAPADAGLPV